MSDGYFNLNYLVPSELGIGGGGFSIRQGAVIGIIPDRTGTSQRRESSVVTTWRFSMRFDKSTLDDKQLLRGCYIAMDSITAV